MMLALWLVSVLVPFVSALRPNEKYVIPDCSCHDEAFKCDRSLANQTNTSIVVPPHLPCDSPRDCYSHCDCGKSQLFTNHILNRMLAVIACHVCGSPPMNVTWYRQDRPLPEGAHCSTETGKTHLLLSNVTEDDCGFYVCVARNAANITYASKVCVYLDQCHHDCASYATVPYPGGHGHHETPGPAVQTDTSSNVVLVAGTVAGTVVVVVLIVAVTVVLLCRKRSEFVSQPSGYEILQELPPSSGTVYLSYACDSDLHQKRVRQVVNKLRLEYSIDCLCYEHYQEEAREQFVFNWVASEIEAASAVIVICSPQYKEIADSHGETEDWSDIDDVTVSEGMKRTRAEWRHIRSHAFTAGTNRCIPVFIDEIQAEYLPLDLATAGPLCWPQDEELVVDRLHSFIARHSDASGLTSDEVMDVVE